MSLEGDRVSPLYRDTVAYVEAVVGGRTGGDLRLLLAGDPEYRRLLGRLIEETNAALERAGAAQGYGTRWGALDAMEPLFLPARDTTLAPLGFAETGTRALREFRLLGNLVGLTREDAATVVQDPGATWSSVRQWIVGRMLAATESVVMGTSARLQEPLPPYHSGHRGRRPVQIVHLPDDDIDGETPAVGPPRRPWTGAGDARPENGSPEALRAAYRAAVTYVERHTAERSPEELRQFLATDDAFGVLVARVTTLTGAATEAGRLAQSQGRWAALSAMEPLFPIARDTTLAPHGFAGARDAAGRQFRQLALKTGLPYSDALTALEEPSATWDDVRAWIINRIDGRAAQTAWTGFSSRYALPTNPAYRSEGGYRSIEIVTLPGDQLPPAYRGITDNPSPPPARPERHQRGGHVPPAP